MPNQTDWILLKKTINTHKDDIDEIWGKINQENARIISNHRCNGKNLFEFLLWNEHFMDANTVASSILLYNEENIQLIYDKHHEKYYEILKLLCTDKMVLLYEQYYNEFLCTENSNKSIESDFNHVYRTAISKRYERMIIDNTSNNIIIDLIDEFKFLTHPYFEDFYQFCNNIETVDYVTEFVNIFCKYIEIVPLIYRIINEYYLEYIKYQLKIIEDICDNSFIIVSEYYENLKMCLSTLPKEYVDYRYQDKNGNNILFYLSQLPYLSDDINQEIYQEFFKQVSTVPLDVINTDKNTIFHGIAIYENETFLEVLLNWINTNMPLDYTINQLNIDPQNLVKTKIVEILLMENTQGKTIYDILIDKNNFTMLVKIIDYMPSKFYLKLTNKLIENFEILDKIPNTEKISQIYLNSIYYFMNNIFQMKQNILYDLENYNEYRTRILKLLAKCPTLFPEERVGSKPMISISQGIPNYYLEWLLICIKINEFKIFKIILSNFVGDLTNYLNKILDNTGETLIISAIKEEKILFVKTLLNYNVDLLLCDKMNLNAIIVAIDTKNIYLMRLIRDHISNNTACQSMTPIMNNIIDLTEKHEIYNVFSVYDTFYKFWKTAEYMINLFLYGSK